MTGKSTKSGRAPVNIPPMINSSDDSNDTEGSSDVQLRYDDEKTFTLKEFYFWEPINAEIFKSADIIDIIFL